MTDRPSKADPGVAVPWKKIENAFVRGGFTIPTLAKRYKVGENTVYRKAKDDAWREKRERWIAHTSALAEETIMARQVEDHVRLYDATRRSVDMMTAVAERVCKDPDGFFRHLVQYEKTEQTGSNRDTEKYVEEKTFTAVNSKTFAEMAKGLRDIALLARTLDGIMDAADRAKIDVDRDKLSLAAKQVGMDDDAERESGIALMPGRDMSLLDSAIPDPGDGQTPPEASEAPQAVKQ